MKKSIALLSIIVLVIVVYSCKKSTDKLNTTVYLDLPATPYVYNAFSSDTAINNKATLGRVLFYDTHLSLNNAIACGSCHKQALGFADNVPLSLGYEGRLTKRNSKSIANLAGDDPMFFDITQPNSPLFWDGREEILQNLIARPVTNHVEMGIDDINALPGKLAALSYYNQLFVNAYGDNAISMNRISECVADFLVAIQSHNSRFDQYIQGNTGAFSPLEVSGFNLFNQKYNCASCHHIEQNTYTTEDFKDIGLDNVYTDLGRGAVTTQTSDNGKFRVPGLRNVAVSAPYMHDGRYKTLSDVIDHYSHGIQNSPNLDFELQDTSGKAMQMNIPDQDKQALIAFLNTMTDYSLLTDPKFSNPFKAK
jgi:cytochrome c peroxidase